MATSACDPLSPILEQASAIAVQLARPAKDDEEAQNVEMMLDSVRTWASRHLDSAKTDANACIAPEIYETAAELGLFGLTIPEEYGGAGFSLSAAARITEEIATFDRSVATAIGLHCGLGLRGLVHFGSDELKKKYLPGLAAGKPIAAFAATEPEAGSHIAGIKTTGTWDNGTGLSVTGEKCYVTNGGIAGLYTILAKTPGLGGARRGYSLLLLTRDMNGITIGAEEHKLGIKGSSTTTVNFDAVAVDTSHVIGEPGKGLDLMNEVLAWGRTLMSAGCLGTARHAYKLASTYVLDRHQFGKPIGSFGLVRQKIAEMRAALFITESVVRLTTLRQSAYGSDIIWESSIAKVLASENAWRLSDDAIQVHGGAGFIEDTGVPRILRDGRITRIFEGANEVLRFHIAAASLGFGAQFSRLSSLTAKLDPRLSKDAERFDGFAHELGKMIDELKTKYGIRVAEHQMLLGQAADGVIGVFALLATLLKAHGELAVAKSPDVADDVLKRTQLASAMLSRDIEGALAGARRPDEEELVNAVSEAEYGRVRANL